MSNEEIAADVAKQCVNAGITLKVLEFAMVKAALGDREHGSINRAARRLGITRDQIRYRIWKWKL